MTRRRLAWFCLALAVATFAVGSAGLSAGLEPFVTWRYLFVWWPYIVAVESILALNGGTSDLFDAPGRFLLLLPLSVTIWLIFEACNFLLDDWSYVGLPAEQGWRWLGYVLAYASVLPGIFATARLLECLGLFRDKNVDPDNARPLRDAAPLRLPLAVTGLVFLALALALPRIFFPLVWLGFGLLLDPINNALGERSLLGAWAGGDLRPLWLLLASGLVCGMLWEYWNWQAGGHWIYHVPYFAGPKLFQMPLAGFLGFPPFAVQCWVMTEAFFAARQRLARLPRGRRLALSGLVLLAAAAFDLAVMAGIDHWTVLGPGPG